MNREQLIEKARVYFKKDPALAVMYATADGNLFYPKNSADARHHSERSGHALFTIERKDLEKKDVVQHKEENVIKHTEEPKEDVLKHESKDVVKHVASQESVIPPKKLRR